MQVIVSKTKGYFIAPAKSGWFRVIAPGLVFAGKATSEALAEGIAAYRAMKARS